jgi:hypothetical protein
MNKFRSKKQALKQEKYNAKDSLRSYLIKEKGERTMRTILKCAVLLFILIMALLVMSCANTVDNELFVHKSPDFTLTVPKWIDQKSKNPNSVLWRVPKPGLSPALEVTVHDLPAGRTYKDTPAIFKKGIESQWNGSDVKIIYEREIKLRDGTPAYEFEVKWNYGKWPGRSYVVVVFKDKKSIWACVTDVLWIGDNLKQYPLSLTLING